MIKKILITLLVLFIVLVLGIVIFLLTFDLNHYRNYIVEQASHALGRPVEIKSLSTKLSLVPTINVEGVRILDPNQSEPLVDVPKLEAIIELTPLIHGQIVVQRIVVPSADLVWTPAKKEATPPVKPEVKKEEKKEESAPKNPPVRNARQTKNTSKLWIESVSVEALKATIKADKTHSIEIKQLVLKDLSKFSFDVIYLGKTINVSANMGSILELTKSQSLSLDLTLKQDKSSVKINGKIDDLANLKKMRFQITANTPNLASLLKSWEIKNKEIPTLAVTFKTSFNGDLEKAELLNTSFNIGKNELTLNTKGTLVNLTKNLEAKLDLSLNLANGALNQLWHVRPFELTTQSKITMQNATFSDIQFNAQKSDANGNLIFDWSKKVPSVSGELNSTYFSLQDIVEPTKSTTLKQQKEKKADLILSNEKLPFDLLKQFNSDVKVNVSHLKLSDEISDYVSLNCTLKILDGVLSMPASARMLGGTIVNQLKVDANQKSIAITTQAKGIQLDKVKSLEKDIKGSSANVNLSLSGTGDSIHELAGSTNGNIQAELTSGQIINKTFNSLPAALNLIRGKNNSLSFSTQDQKTDLLCGAINMPVRNGIAISQNQIALETDTLNFVINGQVNLKNETLDLAMIPSVNQTRGMANELLNISQSVKLTGNWKNIQTKVDAVSAVTDIGKMIGQKLSGEKKENTAVAPTALCQKVLGHSLSGTAPKTQPKPAQQKQVKAPQQQKPDLKQQLVQSLSQALTNQITKKQ